ncbi:hypothetical protein D3C81_1502620 [compost metagenome]
MLFMTWQHHGVAQIELGGKGAGAVGGNGEGVQLELVAGHFQRLDHPVILQHIGVGGAVGKLVF